MKASPFVVRSSRLGLSLLMLLSLNAHPVLAASTSGAEDAGILPIETSKSLIDELFGPDANNGDDGNGNDNGNGNGGRNNNNNGGKNSNQNNGRGNNNQNRNNNNNNNGNGFGGNSKGRNNNNNNDSNNLNDGYQTITRSNVDGNFKCNLFESIPFNNILSAVNALNSAVSSAACKGDSRVNVQGIVDNNAAVASAVKELRGYVENPDTIQADNAADIANKVDVAIRAATSIANSFAQTDLLKKECRAGMSAGQIAMSINDLINGLTPYALMAATLTTGGAAAVPFIVGGSVITGAVSSMGKIIQENSIQIDQADVRRAIVENTCQFIRLDQKYKFLIKSRQEQISKITTDLSASQRLFSAKIGGLSNNTSGLVNQKSALDKANADMSAVMASARGQLELDKQFMKGTSDNIKICQLGIQLATMAKNSNSYISQMMGTLDSAMVAYGTTNIAQAQALKTSGALAVRNLEQVAANQFSGKVNYNSCAQSTKSFVETVDQSASLAKQLLKVAQDNIDRGLQSNKEYGLYKARLSSLNQKKYQADRVRNSLDKLQAYANTITQSEIDSEMSKLRNGLLGGRSSPVMKWFDHVSELHKGEIKGFNQGLKSLQLRATKMTDSAKIVVQPYPGYFQANQKKIDEDAEIGRNLFNFNLKQLPLGTTEHDNVCRELADVWGHWTKAIDHLAAADAFCSMLEPYVYDNRPEDAKLVQMCRGYSASAAKGYYPTGKDIPSTIASVKNELVQNHTRDWALRIKKRMNDLACVDLNQDPDKDQQ